MTRFLAILTIAVALTACKDKPKQENTTQTVEQPLVAAPAFDADSAYQYIDRQLAFGPRVPNTPAHVKTGDFLVAKFKQFGCTVTEQTFVATAWNGKKYNARNIIASYNPDATKRVFVSSHWDSRPFADSDTVKANQTKPVPSANDGASGVGVMLELARTIQLAKTKPTIGIDFICFDVEDLGDGEKAQKDYEQGNTQVDYVGFALGSRYWAKNLHKPGYSAFYGILLDMVGGRGATFPKEAYSMQFAPTVVSSVWQTASRLGYSQYFVDTPGSGIVDDHIAPNLIAKIPTIDIIQMNTQTGMFFSDHHTTTDDMRNIDRGTLKAVGQTLVQVLYNEQ